MEVIVKLIKQRKESIEAFTQGERPELAQKEKMEAQLLQAYLPEALSAEELKTIVDEVIADLGVSGPSAMGQVMKGVLAKVAGRADGKAVSTLVKESLAG